MADDSVYLELFHGREDAYAEMERWGDEGPVLGPLDYVHITYGCDVHISFDGQDFDLGFANDCLGYDGMFYGDFSVISAAKAERLKHRWEATETTIQKLRDQRR